MNETFKKFETLINLSNNQQKKKHYTNDNVNIFEKTLSNDANIKLQKESFEERPKTSKET